jgi:uncharacterized protein (DUF2249 family)
MNAVTAETAIDVRTIAPSDRHPLIFEPFARLAEGEVAMLVNDRDPKLLFY